MRVSVDLTVCSGHAHCEDKCPEVFGTDDVLGKCVIKLADVPAELKAKALLAVKNCPERAITVTGD